MSKSGETDDLSPVLNVPSPCGDAERQLARWVDEVGVPSIEFGPTHTHEEKSGAGIAATVDRARAVLDDQSVVIEDVGGTYPGSGGCINLRQANILKDKLTSPYSPERALLKSWSEISDRFAGMASLPG